MCPHILRVIIGGGLQLLVGQMRDRSDFLSSLGPVTDRARKAALLTHHFCPVLIKCASCDQIKLLLTLP